MLFLSVSLGVHWLLVGLFTQGYYLLYFLVLSVASFFLYKYFDFPSYKQITLFFIIFTIGYIFMYDKWYDIYIDYDLAFPLFYIDSTIEYSLLCVHLLILFLLGYNKRKLF